MSDKSLVVYCKISREDYNSLTIKDEDTLYAVNDNGDFSMANLNDSAELYLGNKKLSPTIVGTTGQSTTAVMHQKAVTDAINELQSDINAKSEDFYGECNISPSTVAKTVTTLNGGFVLKKGAKVSVKFLQGHTASTMTLNVDGTGAKNVYRDGSNLSSTMIKASNVYEFVYDGTYWRIVGVDTDTTYSLVTTSSQGLMSSADKIKLDSMATGAGYEANLKWGGKNLVNTYSPLDASMIPLLGANRFACLPVSKVNIEYSRDKGVTWVDYGATEEEKQALFKEDLNATIQVGGKEATPSIDNMVRITIDTASTLYAILHKFIFYTSNNSGNYNGCHVTISGRTQQNYEDDNNTWVVFTDKAILRGWPGWNVINVNPFYTYGNTKTTQYGQIRFTFGLDSMPTSQYTGLVVLKMSAYGQVYDAPNTLAMYGRPFQYNYDGGMILSKGVEIKGGDIKLANFSNSKIHGFPNSLANAPYSTALGYGSITTNTHQLAIGKYNALDSNVLFNIGFGESENNRATVFKVQNNGDTTLSNLLPNSTLNNIGNSNSHWNNIFGNNIYLKNKSFISWGQANTTFDKNTETLSTGISVWHAVGSNNCDAPSGFSVILNVKGYYMMQLATNALDSTLNFRNSFNKNWEKVFTNNTSLIPNGNYTHNIGDSSNRWNNIYANNIYGTLKGNADTATKVNKALTINHNGTTKTYDGSSAVTIDIASGSSSSGESSIQPFAGFMTGTDMGNIQNQSTNLTGGQVYCSQSKNRFYYKVNGLFYSNYPNASLYNDNYDTSSATAKTGAIFSYNGKHYTMYNGTLQDMSALDDIASSTVNGIVKLSDSTTGSNYGADKGVAATPKAVASVATTARNYTNSKATQTLTSANTYTDEQIAAKILLVPELPEHPIAGVLYCIPE